MSSRQKGSVVKSGFRSCGGAQPHEGESCCFWLLGAPFGLPQVDEAMERAMLPVDGVSMRDVTVYSVHPVYVPFGWHCYRVVGEVFG